MRRGNGTDLIPFVGYVKIGISLVQLEPMNGTGIRLEQLQMENPVEIDGGCIRIEAIEWSNWHQLERSS